MSAIQQMVLAGKGKVTVTGNLTGSGSLSIPAGVTSIVLTGNGGPGTAGASATFATSTVFTYTTGGVTVSPTSVTANTAGALGTFNASNWPPASGITLYDPYLPGNRTATEFVGIGGLNFQYRVYSPQVDAATGGEVFYIGASFQTINGTDATSGTAGASTTASIQSQNITFAGAATGVTSAPSPTVQTFNGLSGAASSMTYSVPAGGSLSYSYTY